MKPLPKQFNWLSKEIAPKSIVEALRHYGTLEILGPDSNPDIRDWAKEIGVQGDYTNDAIPWCGLFVGMVVKRTDGQERVVSKPLWARNWLHYGKGVTVPMLGDILVFQRSSGGHVGFYVGETEHTYAVLGGNQSDAVTVTFILKSRLLGARRKEYKATPSNVRRIHLQETGELSTNEA